MSHEHKTHGGAKVVIERTYRAQIKDVWDLWTTKAGFESWWGPQGFRVEVQTLDARVGGALHYEMIADRMLNEGFTSQLTKLDKRFDRAADRRTT